MIKQREFYKYAKMACLHGFAVTQSVLGSSTEMDLTEDQKKRLENAKKRSHDESESGGVSSTSMDVGSLLLASLLKNQPGGGGNPMLKLLGAKEDVYPRFEARKKKN